MSGFEIFGTVASAIAVIEATWLVKLHITSVKHAKQEKIEMEGELKELKSLVQHISTALDRQSLPSKPALLSLVSKIGDGLNQVDKKRKGTWKVFWHLVKDDIRSVWADLERMRGFLELGLISQIGEDINEHQQENAEQYSTMMNDLKRDLDDIRREVFHGNARIEKRFDDNQNKEIQRWLSPESVYTELDELRKRRAKNSGQWLLNSQSMMEMLDRNSDRGLVIVTGPAGCGKTMLSSTISDALEEKGEKYLPIFIKYASRLDISAVLRNLLSTALGSFATVPDRLIKLHSKQTITENDVSTILQEIIGAQSQIVYIVVDGLDELGTSGAELLDRLRSFTNSRLFVTSRPSAVPKRFHSSILDLEASNEHDLKAYIEEGVTAICNQVRNGHTLTETIISKVIDTSSTLFILASMHITSLGKARNKHDLSDIANCLPRTPNDYYESTLKRIRNRDPRDSDPALASLLWVSQAKRPLNIDEFPIAVATAQYDLTDNEVEDFVQTPEELLELCEGLLWVKDGFVGFSHLTLQEFFTKEEDTWFRLTRSCSGNSQVPCLGIACLGFLNARHIHGIVDMWESRPSWRWYPPFFVYSSRFWGQHMSPVPTDQALIAVSHFENNAAVFKPASQWAVTNSDIGYYVTSVYHVLAKFNLAAYFPEVAGVDKLNVLDNYRHSPLWVACENGSVDVAHLLLKNPNVEADSRDVKGQSPLWIACDNGHIEIVRLLLEHSEVKTDSQNPRGWSPLLVACHNGHVEVARLLLEHSSAEVDLRDKWGQSPLWIACQKGHFEIARLLLESSDIVADSRDKRGQSPFWIACKNGHYEIARLLLENPTVEVDYRNKYGWSPLWVACENGHIEIARLLLENPDVDADFRNEKGQCPLWIAVENGHSHIVRLLLEDFDVEVDFQDKQGISPLERAHRHGYHVIEALLRAKIASRVVI